MVLTIKAG